MLKHKVLRKVLAVSLVATMLAGTGFTAAGQYVGTDISVNATEELVASRYSIIGTFTEWGGATPDVPSDIPMYETEKGVYIGKTGIIPAGDHAFKVRADGKWVESYAAYDEEYDVTRNSIKNIEVTLTENAAIAVMLDTRGDNSDLWPLSYAIVKNDSEEYQWIYTGKGKSPWEEEPTVNDEEESDANDFSYEIGYRSSSGNVAIITGYIGNGGNVVIPKTIDGKTVTDIGSSAFNNCTNITNITIPDSVLSIEEEAFSGCTNLTSIIIPKNVSRLYDNTFKNCTSLTTVTITGDSTDIYSTAFSGCISLKSVNIAENHKYYTSDNGVVLKKDKKTLRLVPSGISEYTIPDSVTYIDSNAFKGSACLKSITIPDSITDIGEEMFKDCVSLTSVTLPDSITRIGKYAFSGCTSLEHIAIPDRVATINENTFYGCTGLKSITIPDNVTTIGHWAFYKCTGLTDVTFGKRLNELPYTAFLDCDNVENITVNENNATFSSVDGVLLDRDKKYIRWFPKNKKGEYVIPDTITSINGIFSGCAGLTSIKIPSTVTTIGDNTFSGCTGLTSITIGSGVTYIYAYSSGEKIGAFDDCEKLENITVSEDNTVYSSDNGVLLNKDKTKILYCPKAKTGSYEMPDSVTEIASGVFTDCGITSMLIGKGFTSSFGTFKDFKNIEKITVSPDNPSYSSSNGIVLNKEKTEIVFCPLAKKGTYTIPGTVTSIGDYVFKNRTGMTKITIPDSVTSIGDCAFDGCAGLTKITIPDGVEYINESTFRGCTGLTSVTLPDSVTYIGSSAFDGCAGLTSINIPDGVTYIGSSAFDGCAGLTSINIPDGVKYINKMTFRGCTGLTSVTLPDNVLSIENKAFSGCTNLKNVTIPDSVTSIGYSAFDGCAGLKSINIPDGVKYINESTFRGCTGLTSVTLPDSVLSIEKEAFSGCTNLADITIGSGLQQISYVAFENCTGIENITVSENNTAFASYDGALLNKRKTAFQLFPKAKKGTYTVPDSMGAIDGYTFTGSSVDKVILPESVTYISDYAFSSSSLKSIMIPDSVEYIGAFAFSDCNNLLSVTIGNGVTEIDETAFRNSPNLTIYGEKDSYAETYANENKIPFSSEILNNKIVLGETVTINAAMISSNGNYTYAVLYKKKADTKWTVKQDYSTNDIITVKPAKATDYDICVKVKDSEGKIVKNFFEAKVNTKLANTSTISATDINKGDTVTVNGFATGGMGEYTYAVLYKKKAETKWTVRQDYSANNEILVRPYTSTDYDICIKVKDKDGTIVKKFFTVIVKDNKLQNTSTISATEIKKGDSVTLKGTATGGAGEYTYAVLYKKKAETKWTVRQGYKTNDEILVRPYTNTDYDICVKVKDKDGTIVKKYFTLTVK